MSGVLQGQTKLKVISFQLELFELIVFMAYQELVTVLYGIVVVALVPRQTYLLY